MGEGAAAVAVAERPDAGNAGPQLVVDGDVAARVDVDAGRLEPEVVGVRPAADGKQHVRADDFGVARRAIDADRDLGAARGEADAFGIEADGDSLGFEDLADRVRHLLVLAGDEARRLLDHGDAAPKRRKICANSRPM